MLWSFLSGGGDLLTLKYSPARYESMDSAWTFQFCCTAQENYNSWSRIEFHAVLFDANITPIFYRSGPNVNLFLFSCICDLSPLLQWNQYCSGARFNSSYIYRAPPLDSLVSLGGSANYCKQWVLWNNNTACHSKVWLLKIFLSSFQTFIQRLFLFCFRLRECSLLSFTGIPWCKWAFCFFLLFTYVFRV